MKSALLLVAVLLVHPAVALNPPEKPLPVEVDGGGQCVPTPLGCIDPCAMCDRASPVVRKVGGPFEILLV